MTSACSFVPGALGGHLVGELSWSVRLRAIEGQLVNTKYFGENMLRLRLMAILKIDYYIMYSCKRSIFLFHF